MTIVDLTAAKEHLNITDSTLDEELTGFIATAEAVIAARCGPLTQRSVTARVRPASTSMLILPLAPAVSVTTLATVAGTAVTVGDVWLDQTTGIVRFTDGYTCFTNCYYDVTFVAGWATVPLDLVMAVKEMLRHLWKTQRGGGVSRPGSSATTLLPGYLIPNEVQSLMAPYVQMTVA